jgi:tetratricopeptide (TPR) repeat protein
LDFQKEELAKMRIRLLIAVIWLAGMIFPAGALAQQPSVPPEGLKAEMAGRWEKAIDVYEDVLDHEPERVDLWLRISDIEAHLGNSEKATKALAEAARLSPNDAGIHFRLSRAYSANNQPELALAAVDRALELDPDNIDYLKARAQLANWIGRSDVASDTYRQLLEKTPEDNALLLDYARSSAWSGHIDRAAVAYEEYLAIHPDDKEVLVEHVKVEAWRGNYTGSMSILGHYYETFGDSEEYRREKARVLAWAGRPTEAMELILPLLEEDPDDYDVNYSHTIALNNDYRPAEAVESLQKLVQLRPEAEETRDIQRVVETPSRPDITFAGSVYSDSDDLDRYHGSIVAGFSPQPETRILGGVETDHLEADSGSGYEKLDGDETERHDRGWMGLEHVVSPEVSVDGHIGVAETDGENRFIYGAGIEYRPKNNLRFRAETDYGFYVISPRTLDLGIRRSSNHLWATWEPDLLHTVVGGVGYNDFSDDNESWEAVVAPRRAVLRREKISLDLGVRGTWYGFDEQLDNGYYDPEFYQSYMATGQAYWKISDDDVVSLALDLGVVKDDEMSDFRFGWGTSVEGVFGLYRDVMLRVGGSFYNSYRTEGGDFEAVEGHIALTFRF